MTHPRGTFALSVLVAASLAACSSSGGTSSPSTTAPPASTPSVSTSIARKPVLCVKLVGKPVTVKTNCNDNTGATFESPGRAGCVLYIIDSKTAVYGKLGGRWMLKPAAKFSLGDVSCS